jgi:heme A synthase
MMKINSLSDKRFLALAMAAALVTFFLMVAGNAVRVLDAAGACPDWPTCMGTFQIPAGVSLNEPLGVQLLHRGPCCGCAVTSGWRVRWLPPRC